MIIFKAHIQNWSTIVFFRIRNISKPESNYLSLLDLRLSGCELLMFFCEQSLENGYFLGQMSIKYKNEDTLLSSTFNFKEVKYLQISCLRSVSAKVQILTE